MNISKPNNNKSSHKAKICFVISPIGEDGSDTYNDFKDVLDYLIKPAIETSGFNLKVIRADEIEKPGLINRDIVDHLSESFIVIADLTYQNPNVFYELGIRHSLSERTILIARNIDDIPSDLRGYRLITYDKSAKGAQIFKNKLNRYLREIYRDPYRPDNPVLDKKNKLPNKKIKAIKQQTKYLIKVFNINEKPKHLVSIELD